MASWLSGGNSIRPSKRLNVAACKVRGVGNGLKIALMHVDSGRTGFAAKKSGAKKVPNFSSNDCPAR